MRDRDLIVGVLAAQAGFVTPSEVLTAAAAGLVDSASDSLLTRLEKSGALNEERRKTLEALAEQALAARNGDVHAVANSLGGAALLETLVSKLNGSVPADTPQPTGTEVPLERPGQYTRLRELGRGSQSVVRAAQDDLMSREVALKELVTGAAEGPDGMSFLAARARFLREVRLVASLDHPGIVAIHDLAQRPDGTLFCTQKLIRGETLQARLAKCRSLGERLGLLRHVLDACQAVGFAHSKHVIHRDLKPSNIMVGEYGETVVVDWGLAKHREEAEEAVPLVPSSPEPGLTVAGVALGTPAYMSPEQARGDLAAIDARSDVFSLGAILYQLLTGRPPFEGATSDHILENVRAGKFPPVRTLAPDAPPELAAIADRALRPDPVERYPNAEELARELSAYLTGGRVRAYQYGTWQLARRFVAGHRALTAGLAVGLAALLVSAVVVAVRLQVVRGDLARSFIERAHAAERESDWALAAANFAAARTHRDTPEARWGVALAEEQAIEHVLSVQGSPGSFTDVSALQDGRLVVLGVTGNRVEVRELEGGKQLWSRDAEFIGAAAFLPRGQVRLSLPSGWAFFDAATGRQLGMFDRQADGRPCPGPYRTPVTIVKGQLIARREGQPSVALPAEVETDTLYCAVSDDGRRVAARSSSGRVFLLSVTDGRKHEEREGAGLRALAFSSHGLVIVRQGWLEVLGGPDGDFSVPLAERSSHAVVSRLGGVAVSPDGHLVVVARIASSRADVIDLRTRAVRGTLHYARGWPRFSFSLDGRRVFAAGLGGASRLVGWRLPPDEFPSGHPGRWPSWSVSLSPKSQQMAIVDRSKSTVELYGTQGQLLAKSPVPPSLQGNELVADGVVALFDVGTQSVSLRDVVQDRDLWTHRCSRCAALHVSADGSRLVQLSQAGLEVWDSRANRVLFAETARLTGLETSVSLSPDGQWVAWSETATMHLRQLDSGRERALRLDSSAAQVGFSPDARRIAVVTSGSLSLWDVAAGRAVWTVPHNTPDRPSELQWSTDAGSFVVRYEGQNAELVDAGSGARLARFPATEAMQALVRPDLRAKLILSESNWEFRPLPQPAADSPSEGLARILQKTGLALEGVEVVAAPQERQ